LREAYTLLAVIPPASACIQARRRGLDEALLFFENFPLIAFRKSLISGISVKSISLSGIRANASSSRACFLEIL
jgi:hypothetical protein